MPAPVSTVFRIRSGTYHQVPNFAKNRAVLVGTSILSKLLHSSIFFKIKGTFKYFFKIAKVDGSGRYS